MKSGMTNKEWLMSLSYDELANELLNFANLHKTLVFNAVDSLNAVSWWLSDEHVDERTEFDNKEIIQNGQDDSQWSKELTQCSWYPGKYNGGGWPPR